MDFSTTASLKFWEVYHPCHEALKVGACLPWVGSLLYTLDSRHCEAFCPQYELDLNPPYFCSSFARCTMLQCLQDLENLESLFEDFQGCLEQVEQKLYLLLQKDQNAFMITIFDPPCNNAHHLFQIIPVMDIFIYFYQYVYLDSPHPSW